MNFFNELREFGRGVFVWLVFWLVFSLFFFFFGLEKIRISGAEIFLPWLSPFSFSVLFFQEFKNHILPAGTQIIVLTPLSAFLGQAIISFFLGFLAVLPLFFYKILAFLLPAFHTREKRTALAVFFPSVVLFFSGCAFAYFFIMPATFKILYSFAAPLGVIPYFDLNSFLFLALGLEFVVGLVFTLPVLMSLLAFFKIVPPDFWIKQWQYAFFSFLLIGAAITPDGTGITMMLLVIPLTLLYLAGYTVSKIIK